jgi:hypothetical protein
MNSQNSEQRRELAWLHALREALFEGCREQGQVALAGVATEGLQRAGADTAPRRAHGADEGRVVVLLASRRR